MKKTRKNRYCIRKPGKFGKFLNNLMGCEDDSLIVSKSEIEAEVKEDLKKGRLAKDDEEPTLFHYVVVLLVFFLIFFTFYLIIDYLERDAVRVSDQRFNIEIYDYEFELNGDLAKIQFYNPVEVVLNMQYPIEITKFDLLNSEKLYFSFMQYNGTDNGEVVRTSARLIPFLKKVYNFNLDLENDIVSFDEINCSNSTYDEKVIVFNPYSNRNGVFYDRENACITFETDDPFLMRDIGDKFFYNIINE